MTLYAKFNSGKRKTVVNSHGKEMEEHIGGRDPQKKKKLKKTERKELM